ncbi:MAG TPA: VOC family protein [Spirochaetia bacterium]|nr:VOC family protein [Spirochaetia bacterium]
MAKVIIGNHSAIRASKQDRERIRRFDCDVLGGKILRELEDKDDLQLGDDLHIAFLYSAGGREVDKGVRYAAESPLSEKDFLKAIYLELKSDDVEEMRQKITSFGVNVLPVPDPHLYFQAPGGQVFRLVGINEDLSRYERNQD